MQSPPVFIVSAVRTPIGSYLGALSSLSATKLGSIAIEAALARARLAPDQVDEVFFGNVLSAALGQAPARQAALGAKLPNRVPCTTVNKVCGSGLAAVVLGARLLRLGEADIVVCGGMESMSNVPYYLTQARSGYRMGDGKLVDGMILDGLWDPYNDFHMGMAGELCADKYSLSREAQDEFARESYTRAREAIRTGKFDAEIAEVSIPQRKGEPKVVDKDEEPERTQLERFSTLRPAFSSQGTITAANASSINDGAACVVLASARAVKEHGLSPLARWIGDGTIAQQPEWFTTAPAGAIKATLAKLELKSSDIDLWEINEAFSCVAMSCTKLCDLDPATVNVHGGAVALGHPIGASGARILTTLLYALSARQKRRGLATLCLGGGEAIAAVVERE